MATVKFLNAAGKYSDPAARDDVIRYITQKCKTPSGYIGSGGVELPYAARQMQAVAESFKKDNKVRIRHFVVSFYRNEAIDPYKANLIASMRKHRDVGAEIAHDVICGCFNTLFLRCFLTRVWSERLKCIGDKSRLSYHASGLVKLIFILQMIRKSIDIPLNSGGSTAGLLHLCPIISIRINKLLLVCGRLIFDAGGYRVHGRRIAYGRQLRVSVSPGRSLPSIGKPMNGSVTDIVWRGFCPLKSTGSSYRPFVRGKGHRCCRHLRICLLIGRCKHVGNIILFEVEIAIVCIFLRFTVHLIFPPFDR